MGDTVVSGETGVVVAIDGGPVNDARIPVPGVVAAVERLLTLAQSGEMQGLTVALLYHDASTDSFSVGNKPTYGIVGRLAALQQDLVQSLVGDADG